MAGNDTKKTAASEAHGKRLRITPPFYFKAVAGDVEVALCRGTRECVDPHHGTVTIECAEEIHRGLGQVIEHAKAQASGRVKS